MDTSEQFPQTQSIYTMSAGQIAWRNFLAGFMHGLGGFFITILSWVVMYYLFITIVFPQVKGYLDQAQSIFSTLQQISQPAGRSGNTTQPTIQIPSNIFDQLQQLQPTQQ